MSNSFTTNTPWTPLMENLLVYWRRDRGFTFERIADLVTRESGVAASKNGCIGKYTRLKAHGLAVDFDLIKDYLPGENDEPDNHL